MTVASYTLLGVRLDAFTIHTLMDQVREAIEGGERKIYANHNLHSVYLFHHDLGFRSFYAVADQVYVDGMSLILLGRILGLPLKRKNRLTSLDWQHAFFREAVKRNWQVFYLGSSPGVVERGAENLRRTFPGLQISTRHGFFDARPASRQNQEVLEAIDVFRPDALLVGMGMPRQEKWIHENLRSLSANVIFTIGGYIDYLAGEIPTPPRWAGRWGLEWLFRLLAEPRRLWRRYLVEPWFVLGLFFSEYLRQLRSSE